jgi:hypothetical protein
MLSTDVVAATMRNRRNEGLFWVWLAVPESEIDLYAFISSWFQHFSSARREFAIDSTHLRPHNIS